MTQFKAGDEVDFTPGFLNSMGPNWTPRGGKVYEVGQGLNGGMLIIQVETEHGGQHLILPFDAVTPKGDASGSTTEE